MSQVTGLQAFLKTPTVLQLVEVNQVVSKFLGTQGRMGLFYWRLQLPIRVVSVSDASAANKRSDRASEGKCVCVAEDLLPCIDTDKFDQLNIEQVTLLSGKHHLLVGTSNVSKRISHSTSHGETLACTATIPIAQLVAMRIAEIELIAQYGIALTPMKLMQIQDDGQCPVFVDHYIDCMDLWDLACGKKGIPQDKSQRLAILSIREERRALRLRRFYHITTQYMLADLLTKFLGYYSPCLQQLLSTGRWTIGPPITVRHLFGKEGLSEAKKSKRDV